MTRLVVRPLTLADAQVISEWRYPDAWAVYNGPSLDPADHWAVDGESDGLVGFYCTGSEARVPGLEAEDSVLDIGVGMRPDLVGRGMGRHFVTTVMAHCRQTHAPRQLRSVVQSWNERSLRVAQDVGFESVGIHVCVQEGASVTYTVLIAPLD